MYVSKVIPDIYVARGRVRLSIENRSPLFAIFDYVLPLLIYALTAYVIILTLCHLDYIGAAT